jgi:hypothetical protein
MSKWNDPDRGGKGRRGRGNDPLRSRMARRSALQKFSSVRFNESVCCVRIGTTDIFYNAELSEKRASQKFCTKAKTESIAIVGDIAETKDISIIYSDRQISKRSQ